MMFAMSLAGRGFKNSHERQCGWDGWVARSYDGGKRFVNRTRIFTADLACQGGTRFDTQPNMFFDTRSQQYVGTARASRDPVCGIWYPQCSPRCIPKGKCNCSGAGAERTISITRSPTAAFTDGSTRWSSWRGGVGSKEHQYHRCHVIILIGNLDWLRFAYILRYRDGYY
eukprot:COSAG01_NODE_3839_length_5646_cov_8.715934_3_plen_170_part_00